MSAQAGGTVESQSVLNLPMQPNDAGAATIRDYLVALLTALWEQQEGFGGKRPFGNSGWSYDLYLPLLQAGFVEGLLDEEGDIMRVDEPHADRLIADAIQQLGRTS